MCDVIGGGWWKGPREPGGTQANSKQGSEASQQTELGAPLVALSLTFRKHHCVPAIIRRAHTALLAPSLTRTAPTSGPGIPGRPPTCHCSSAWLPRVPHTGHQGAGSPQKLLQPLLHIPHWFSTTLRAPGPAPLPSTALWQVDKALLRTHMAGGILGETWLQGNTGRPGRTPAIADVSVPQLGCSSWKIQEQWETRNSADSADPACTWRTGSRGANGVVEACVHDSNHHVRKLSRNTAGRW